MPRRAFWRPDAARNLQPARTLQRPNQIRALQRPNQIHRPPPMRRRSPPHSLNESTPGRIRSFSKSNIKQPLKHSNSLIIINCHPPRKARLMLLRRKYPSDFYHSNLCHPKNAASGRQILRTHSPITKLPPASSAVGQMSVQNRMHAFMKRFKLQSCAAQSHRWTNGGTNANANGTPSSANSDSQWVAQHYAGQQNQ